MKMSLASPIPRISRLGQPCCHWSVATNGPSKRPRRPIAARPGERCSYFFGIGTTTTTHYYFIVRTTSFQVNSIQSSSTADERLKQRLREASLCARAGGVTVMPQRSFFWTQCSNSLPHLQFHLQYHQHQHDRPAEQHHHPADPA